MRRPGRDGRLGSRPSAPPVAHRLAYVVQHQGVVLRAPLLGALTSRERAFRARRTTGYEGPVLGLPNPWARTGYRVHASTRSRQDRRPARRSVATSHPAVARRVTRASARRCLYLRGRPQFSDSTQPLQSLQNRRLSATPLRPDPRAQTRSCDRKRRPRLLRPADDGRANGSSPRAALRTLRARSRRDLRSRSTCSGNA